MDSFVHAASVRAFDVRWARGCGGLEQRMSSGPTDAFRLCWHPVYGRMMVAVSSMPCGAFIFSEPPLLVAPDIEGLGQAETVAVKLLCSPAQRHVAAKLLQTAHHPTEAAREALRDAAVELLEKQPEALSGCSLELVIWALGLAAVNTHSAHGRAVLGLLASMPHHDCNPNCFVHVGPPAQGSHLTLRTMRAVKAGEALSISYCPLYLPRTVRRTQLYQQHGFVCGCDRCVGGTVEYVRAFRCPLCNEGPASPATSSTACRSLVCDACGRRSDLGEEGWHRLLAAEAEGGVLSASRLLLLHPYHHLLANIVRYNLPRIRDVKKRARAYAELAAGMGRLTSALDRAVSLAEGYESPGVCGTGSSHPLLARDLEGSASALYAAGDARAIAQLDEAAICWQNAGRMEESERCRTRLSCWSSTARSDWAEGVLGTSRVHNSREKRLAEDPAFLNGLGRDPPAELAAVRLAVADAAAAGACGMSTRSTPAVIGGCPHVHGVLGEMSRRCGHLVFEVAPDVKLTLDELLDYAKSNTVDSPYYLVEKRFEGPKEALLQGFEPPPFFGQDVLAHVPGSRQARYLFVGGARTGTFLHVDPLYTSAWNACASGAKRWCFFPPRTDLKRHGLRLYKEGRHQSASVWFAEVYPKLRAAAERGELKMVECVQRAGDVVYVPPGWFHTVINLEPSVAFSQNFISVDALPTIWPLLRRVFPAFGATLRDVLLHVKPDLAAKLQPMGMVDAPGPHLANESGSHADHDEMGGYAELAIIDLDGADLPLLWRDAELSAPSGHVARKMSRASDVHQEGESHVLFVELEWLVRLVAHRPTASVVISKGSAAPLLAYHTQLAALACVLRRKGAQLCLLQHGNNPLPDQLRGAMAEHGLRWRICASPGKDELDKLLMCKEQSWAILRADRRLEAAAEMLSKLPTPPVVIARLSVESTGSGLECVTSRNVGPGSVLLEVPLSMCVVVPLDAESMPKAQAEAKAESALRDILLQRRGEDGDGEAMATLPKYLRNLMPLERLALTDIGCWREFAHAASEVVKHSVAFKRACSWLDRIEHERTVQGGRGTTATPDEWLWASLVSRRSSRVVDVAEEARRPCEGAQECRRRVFCPIADLAAHDSLGANASLELHLEGCKCARCACARREGTAMQDGCVRLVSRYAIDAREVVTISYDPDADFADLFERHAFFDATATIHTAEVVPQGDVADLLRAAAGSRSGAPPRADRRFEARGGGDKLSGRDHVSDAGGQRSWRSELLSSLAEMGLDVATGAWWIPDHHVLACPLLGALRAALLEEDEFLEMQRKYPNEAPHQLLLRPTSRESEARHLFGRVIREHLEIYGTTLDEDGADDKEDESVFGAKALDAARRFVTFETRLLREVLHSL